jgi:hypothetical protein
MGLGVCRSENTRLARDARDHSSEHSPANLARRISFRFSLSLSLSLSLSPLRFSGTSARAPIFRPRSSREDFPRFLNFYPRADRGAHFSPRILTISCSESSENVFEDLFSPPLPLPLPLPPPARCSLENRRPARGRTVRHARRIKLSSRKLAYYLPDRDNSPRSHERCLPSLFAMTPVSSAPRENEAVMDLSRSRLLFRNG